MPPADRRNSGSTQTDISRILVSVNIPMVGDVVIMSLRFAPSASWRPKAMFAYHPSSNLDFNCYSNLFILCSSAYLLSDTIQNRLTLAYVSNQYFIASIPLICPIALIYLQCNHKYVSLKALHTVQCQNVTTVSLSSIIPAAARRLHLIAFSVTLPDAIKDIEFCNNVRACS